MILFDDEMSPVTGRWYDPKIPKVETWHQARPHGRALPSTFLDAKSPFSAQQPNPTFSCCQLYEMTV